ncbi:hypothetical protein GCM10010458_36730 [Microbacterium luteolum]
MQIVSGLRADDLAQRLIRVAASEGEAAAAASLRFAGLTSVTPIAGTASQAGADGDGAVGCPTARTTTSYPSTQSTRSPVDGET